MADNHVHLVVSMTIKPGLAEEFARRFSAEVIAPTLKETGCLRYELLQDEKDDHQFALIEEWTTAEDLAAHGQSAHIAASRAWSPTMRASSELRRYRAWG